MRKGLSYSEKIRDEPLYMPLIELLIAMCAGESISRGENGVTQAGAIIIIAEKE
ncbi:MAG: hypothetical protein NVSMB44_21000 [Ktedonobacteraceae bacterium]